MKVWRPQTAYALRQGSAWTDMLSEIDAHQTVEAVWTWWGEYLTQRHRDYPEGWSLALRDACEARVSDLMARAHHAEMDAEYRATVGL